MSIGHERSEAQGPEAHPRGIRRCPHEERLLGTGAGTCESLVGRVPHGGERWHVVLRHGGTSSEAERQEAWQPKAVKAVRRLAGSPVGVAVLRATKTWPAPPRLPLRADARRAMTLSFASSQVAPPARSRYGQRFPTPRARPGCASLRCPPGTTLRGGRRR